MQQISRAATLALAVSASLVLAACGGGGGGSVGTTTTTTTTTTGGSPTPTTTAASTTLASPQYASGSPELAAFQKVNADRAQCGFPALQENTLLDQAAQNHMTYMQDNAYVGHDETSGLPGYTGATPYARFMALGYFNGAASSYAIEENGGYLTNPGGANAITGLESVPYHLAFLMQDVNNFGATYNTVVLGPLATVYVPEFTLGYAGTAPKMGTTNTPLTFPCQGTTGVDYESAATENPGPLGINTGTNPIGTPIAVVGNWGDTITLSSVTISDTATGANVPSVDMLDSTTDSNQELNSNEAVAFPASPLAPNTSYMATVVGTDNGVSFSEQFTFTTGSLGKIN